MNNKAAPAILEERLLSLFYLLYSYFVLSATS